MTEIPALLLAKTEGRPIQLLPGLANRHGLIAGATGTGKTVTLQRLAEGFSAIGVPVFLSDVKGDLAGLAAPGEAKGKIAERRQQLALEGEAFRGFPVIFWDLFGNQGHPVRSTISEMGPLLLARLLGLNEVQTGLLAVVFKLADDEGLLLVDLKDLRAILAYAAENAAAISAQYGNVASASVGAVQRALLELESQGGDRFFGEPALSLGDLMMIDPAGQGAVNILAADQLMRAPKSYATFLLWLLAELFEALPEVGDLEKPKLVFFFDEAHLLFDEAPKALLEKIEQVVRLIRSKGVAIFFVTQNPLDIPDAIAAQLGNRIQHGLRAFTPKEQRAVKAAAETFRPNPKLDVARAILELGVGEALISLLEASGAPALVERGLVCPPRSRLGAIAPEARSAILSASPMKGRYDQAVDRESAFEILKARAEQAPAPTRETESAGRGGWRRSDGGAGGGKPTPRREERSVLRDVILGNGRRQGVAEAMVKSVARSVGSQIGRKIVRGVLGSLLR